MHFENTTKPQREGQKYHLEHTISTLSRRLQCFSKRAHKKYYKTAVFWAQGYPKPNPLDKNRGLESTCAPNPKESTILSQKRFKCEPSAGSRIRPRKNKAFERTECRHVPSAKPQAKPGEPHAEGPRWRIVWHQTPSNELLWCSMTYYQLRWNIAKEHGIL